MEKDLHSGHRQRMMEKLIASPDSFAEHEYLEVVLFSLLKRQNTNPLAHRLIKEFGSLKGVFNATVYELMSVEGVGKSVANGLFAIGRAMKQVNKKQSTTNNWSNISSHLVEIVNWFDDKGEEKLVLLLLDGNYHEISKIECVGGEPTIKTKLTTIASEFARFKPKYLILAHNHPSGSAEPSATDDYSIMKFNMLCELHGVNIVDKIIVADDEVYSYKLASRLNDVKQTATLKNFFEDFLNKIEITNKKKEN